MPDFPTDGPRVQLSISGPDRNRRRPLWEYSGLSAEEGRYGDGTLSVTLDLHANDLDPALFVNSVNGYGVSLDLEIVANGTTYPLNKYALIDHKIFFGDNPAVTISAVSMLQHILTRRLMYNPTNAKFSFIGVVPGLILSSWLPLAYTSSPSGYTPAYAYASRADTAPWTLAFGSFDNGTAVSVQEESSGNLLSFVMAVCDKSNHYLTFAESPVNTFTISGQYPYQREDKSTKVVFSDGVPPLVGNGLLLQPPVLLTDFRALANTFWGGGSGKEAGQVKTWVGSLASKAKYGIHESSRTVAAISSTTALAAEFQHQVDKLGEPLQTWEIDVSAAGELLLGRDFNRGTKITFYHSSFAEFGLSPVSDIVVGWRLTADADGRPQYSLTLGDIPLDYWGQLFASGGVDGATAAGSRFDTKGGW